MVNPLLKNLLSLVGKKVGIKILKQFVCTLKVAILKACSLNHNDCITSSTVVKSCGADGPSEVRLRYFIFDKFIRGETLLIASGGDMV